MLVGPRQVGKTTLLLQIVESFLEEGLPAANLTYFDFSDDRLTREVSPREVVEMMPAACRNDLPRWFLFDEISRAQRWDAWLKQAVDTTKHRYLVTDSAASLLRDGSTESGLGRWDEVRIEGLDFSEFLRLQSQEGESTERTLSRLPSALPNYLALGGFPEHSQNASTHEVRRRLRSDIADRAVLRDLARRGVRDLERIKDLFVYLIQDSGAILNARSRAEALVAHAESADPRSVRGWIRMLEDTHLIVPLPRRSGSPTARLKSGSRPKIYAADHGLICAFSASADPMLDPADRGRVFEAVVFRHLREIAPPENLSYFRVNDDLEIDFVLQKSKVRLGIEVTSSRDPDSRKIGRLREAGKELRADRLILIHDGYSRPGVPGVDLVSIQQFLLDPKGLVT